MFEDRSPLDSGETAVRSHWPRYAAVLAVLLVGFAVHEASDIYGKANSRPVSTDRVRSRGGGMRPGGAFRAPARAGGPLSPADVRAYSNAPLYDPTVLRTIFLQFATPNWEQELASLYHSGKEMPATVTIDGTVYRNVGVHFRGNSSYRMVPAGYKRSLNLSFDQVLSGQQVGGYRTLNLLNANGDPTFLRTFLYSEIARHYVPTPKVSFVRVAINGENRGVYLNVQQFNKEFIRDFYRTTKGARWKVPGSPRGRAGLEYLGDSIDFYRNLYEIKTKNVEKSWSDLVRLCRLLSTTPPGKLEAVLAPHLDIDGALKFLALEVALVNTDGYWTRASDYSIYQDEAGRFHILPYDFNEAMGVQGPGRRGSHGGPSLDPLVGADDQAKPLRSKLLAVPALRERYLEYVRDIAERWMDWDRLSPMVRQYQSLIEAEVKADGRKLYSSEAFDTADLQRFFDQRRAFLLQ